MYKLKITAKAKKELRTITNLYANAIAEAFEEIKEDPSIGKPLTRELTRKYTYKVASYRIIYRVNKKDKTVIIITAGHRSTVYTRR